ncbi:hypothetical protein MXD61_08190 [Frankia sp. AgPm24]|uniref:DUF7919 family protein n=1 Tax=Frankia sp. AgPm24 TaxID=631128 RepID=UPI00200BED40|nr:hypothetical protein [Frankia sp. AgPm24]MCK9921865.1 hypothetical protein [Frankia sp. AgPm24]
MPYQQDLATYPNLEMISRNFGWPPPGAAALAVGRLAPEHEFPTTLPDDAFLDALFYLCAHHSIMRVRSFHNCLLPHATRPAAICVVRRGDEEVRLGSAEIGVVAAGGELLLAPNLVFHYIEEHHYQPPAIFTEAVLARRTITPPAGVLL